MDAETAKSSGIPPEYLHKLSNGSYVHRGMFRSFGPGANCTLDLCPIEWTVYQYRPSLPANIVFVFLYAVALSVHIYLGIRWRTWGFMAFMVLGCVYALIGYCARIILWTDPWSFGGFMAQMIFITGGPVFYTAAIYVTLSRAVRFFAPDISRLPPRMIYWLFISADILCLILQAAGGALSSTSNGSSKTGIDLAMTGLILQVIILVVFCGFFVDYMVRFAKLQKRRPGAVINTIAKRQKLFFAGLGSAIVLILARCAYRVDELSEGYSDSTKITNEALFIGLEGVLIYLAVVSLMVGHPGFGFKETSSAYYRNINSNHEMKQLTKNGASEARDTI
ncbi:hypothetical protein FDECE_5799 [Fusarium decemcellulare]|nr:hypothetical protein FDECE_5799 [Fusarium decemcellulare]